MIWSNSGQKDLQMEREDNYLSRRGNRVKRKGLTSYKSDKPSILFGGSDLWVWGKWNGPTSGDCYSHVTIGHDIWASFLFQVDWFVFIKGQTGLKQ
ncbi:hypothetical protein TNCV_2282221 [Trichonephila clavipes]|nr:hypothetical protein TNCV_2282221 [Trichonephila clavipes]